MLMDGYWCLWRPINTNGGLVVLMEAYGGPWKPMDANGWLLVLMEADRC